VRALQAERCGLSLSDQVTFLLDGVVIWFLNFT
jgi:hypothetical protein